MYREKVLQRIREYCFTNYPKIDEKDIKMGEAPFNYKCHINTVQKVKEGKAEDVYLCVAIYKNDRTDICVHFINRDKKGKFVENTWGWCLEDYNYYLIRKVNKGEYYRIGDILQYTKRTLINLNSTWLGRFINRVDEHLI